MNEIILYLVQMPLGEWLLLVSSLVMLVGAIGLFRFPDVYTRMHASNLIAVGGVCFSLFVIIISSFLQGLFSSTLMMLIFILVFIVITSPVATQAISESAYRKGIKPARNEKASSGSGNPGSAPRKHSGRRSGKKKIKKKTGRRK